MLNNQKRRASAAVHIAFLAAATLTVLGCEQSPDIQAIRAANTPDKAVVYIYKDVESCAKHGIYTKEYCELAFGQSVAEYKRNAPRYPKKDDCKQVSDDCVESSSPTPGDKKDKEEKERKDNQQAQPQPVHHGGGGAVVVVNSNSAPYYSPRYGGFAIAESAPGSSAPPTPMPVYPTKTGLTTPSGITGLNTGEVMSVPRSAVGASAMPPSVRAGVSGVSSARVASSIAPSASIRGGFGGVGRGMGLGSVGG